MANESNQPVSILRRRQVQARTGYSQTSLYARLDPKSPYYDPTFPKPIKLGDSRNSCIGFVASEVDAWIARRIEISRAPIEKAA